FDAPGDAFSGAWTPDPGVELPGPLQDLLDNALDHNIVPGWSHHAGGGQARVIRESGNYVLALPGSCVVTVCPAPNDQEPFDPPWAGRRHNRMYVPSFAGFLSFSLKRFRGEPADDLLLVQLGSTVIGSFPLDTDDTQFKNIDVPIPRDLRNQVE